MTGTTYDLRELAETLCATFTQIQALYLFGSRRYRTGSPRSDVDILVELTEGTRVRPQELRAFSGEHCTALDLFVADGGKAISCANESFVQAESFGALVSRLEAILFWKKSEGPVVADIDWRFELPHAVGFVPTAMITEGPVSGIWPRSFRSHARDVEAAGLPIQPYIGSTIVEVANFLVLELQRAVTASADLNPKGKGLKVDLKTEYDFQNLFFLTVKPWLPGLAREELTIRYDGQDKVADFNLFSNQIVLELKHVRDSNTKAAVAKTLDGLSSFYASHPNIRVLIIAVLVANGVALDDSKWESDFSFTQRDPQVWTRIFRVP